MKKGLFSKVLIVFIIAANIVFTIWVLNVFREVAAEPTALIASWFAFTTGELWMLASIKKTKTLHGEEGAEK